MSSIREKGINKTIITNISKLNNEPKWVRDFRLNSYEEFMNLSVPTFGPEIKLEYDKINKTKETVNVKKSGNVVVLPLVDALDKYSLLIKKHFNKVIVNNENKYSALNGAMFTSMTFIYVTKDNEATIYINSNNELDRYLIIVEENSKLNVIEGLKKSNVKYYRSSIVEVYLNKNSICNYVNVSNYNDNIINIDMKRAILEDSSSMNWINVEHSSNVCISNPSSLLKGNNSSSNSIYVSSSYNDEKDIGSKMVHYGKNTKSNVTAKLLALSNSNITYRCKTIINSKALNSKGSINCLVSLNDSESRIDIVPDNLVNNNSSKIDYNFKFNKLNKIKLTKYLKQELDKLNLDSESIIGGLK